MKFNQKGIFIGKNVQLGKNIKIGDYATIYDNCSIGDNTIINNHSVIGEPTNNYYDNDDYTNPTTTIGANSLIRSHSIIYAGNKIGNNFTCGHFVVIREYNKIGENCSIGNNSEIHGSTIINDYCRIHSNCQISKKCEIGPFCMIFPYTGMADDKTPPSYETSDISIGAFSIIGAATTFYPGVSVGKRCVTGANTVILEDLPDDTYVYGTKFRQVKTKHLEVEHSKYPWMPRFSRGMPWNKEGFEVWIKTQKEYKF